jgi:hypothetical protein
MHFSRLSPDMKATSFFAFFRCVLLGALIFNPSVLSAQLFDLDANAGKTLRGEDLLPRPMSRPVDFDCSPINGIDGSKPEPHYLDWDQDGYLEKDAVPILLCADRDGTFDYGLTYEFEYFSANTRIIEAWGYGTGRSNSFIPCL